MDVIFREQIPPINEIVDISEGIVETFNFAFRADPGREREREFAQNLTHQVPRHQLSVTSVHYVDSLIVGENTRAREWRSGDNGNRR